MIFEYYQFIVEYWHAVSQGSKWHWATHLNTLSGNFLSKLHGAVHYAHFMLLLA